MILELVTKARWTVLAVQVDGSCQLLEYLEQLGEDPDVGKMLARLVWSAENGPSKNSQQCRYPLRGLSNHVGEFKAGGLRAYFFYDADMVIICSHVGRKPKSKQLKREVAHVEGVRKAYLKAKERGEVVIRRETEGNHV